MINDDRLSDFGRYLARRPRWFARIALVVLLPVYVASCLALALAFTLIDACREWRDVSRVILR